jgi:hypothetical protein
MIIGQHFTNKNIFSHSIFQSWLKSALKNSPNKTILEPFAGKNSIITMLSDLKLINKFQSYDISPQDNNVIQNDSIKNFPENFKICITNPPFLARPIATKKKINIDIYPYFDLYEKCIDLCLFNCDYVAVIIPESFIVTKYFKSRLFAVISITEKSIFNSTEHPVCLALFNKETTSDFAVYRNEDFLGHYNSLKQKVDEFLNLEPLENIKFHCKDGQIGLINIDATLKNKKINFCLGEIIPSDEVNSQSKLRTRIKIMTPKGKEPSKGQISSFIKTANNLLLEYRMFSNDVFMTAFKGLNNDGKYRRRLDYTTAKKICALAYQFTFK